MKHHVLIVEDEEVLRSAFAQILRLEDFEVSEAGNGKMAIELIESTRPDLIILDVLMPVMGGIEFLEKSQPALTLPKTKILVLSNLSDKQTIARVIELGATRHCVKSSLSPKELVSIIHELLEIR